MSLFSDLLGTTKSFFRIGKTGPRLKDNAGNLDIRNPTDTADVEVTAAQFNASGDVGLVINSNATGAGADWKISVDRPTSGMTADWTLTLPVGPGTAGDVLQTDGAGNTTWVAPVAQGVRLDSTSFSFSSGSVVPAFTLPSGDIIDRVQLVVDTPFDGTPSISVGINGGSASKYMGANDNWLDASAKTVFENHPGELPAVSSEGIELYFSAGSSTTGAGRVIVYYGSPV